LKLYIYNNGLRRCEAPNLQPLIAEVQSAYRWSFVVQAFEKRVITLEQAKQAEPKIVILIALNSLG
jgi:hypothetical protein